MSAWVVSELHISAIVGFAYHYCPDSHIFRLRKEAPEVVPDVIGQILLDENYKSVNYRYPDDTPGWGRFHYEWDLSRLPVNPVAVLSLIACLEYQSCEHPEWEQSEAHAILKTIKAIAIRQLPGYDKYPWAIDDSEGLAKARMKYEPEAKLVTLRLALSEVQS